MTAAVTESYECGAVRLLEAVAVACEPDMTFVEQVEASFRAALALFTADPDLGRLLTMRPFEGDGEAIDCYLDWQRRYGELLAAAAARDRAAFSHPPFVAPALISGICWRISQHLNDEGAKRIEDLLPGLLEVVFVSYLGAEQTGRLVKTR